MGEPDLRFRRDMLGVEQPTGEVRISRDAVLEYCRAVGERGALYTDEAAARAAGHPDLLVPPGFFAVFVRGQGQWDIGLEFPGLQVLATLAIEVLAPVSAGEILRTSTLLKEVYAKTGRSGTMVFIVWETVFRNGRDEEAVRTTESYVRRAAQSGD